MTLAETFLKKYEELREKLDTNTKKQEELIDSLIHGDIELDSVPFCIGKEWDAFVEKHGKAEATEMYLHQLLLVLVVKLGGEVEISETEWNKIDPDGVLTWETDSCACGFKLTPIIIRDEQSYIKDKNREHYRRFKRVERKGGKERNEDVGERTEERDSV